nr:hypothetical protein BaRGS_032299 [Batillaria attramentaria]
MLQEIECRQCLIHIATESFTRRKQRDQVQDPAKLKDEGKISDEGKGTVVEKDTDQLQDEAKVKDEGKVNDMGEVKDGGDKDQFNDEAKVKDEGGGKDDGEDKDKKENVAMAKSPCEFVYRVDFGNSQTDLNRNIFMENIFGDVDQDENKFSSIDNFTYLDEESENEVSEVPDRQAAEQVEGATASCTPPPEDEEKLDDGLSVLVGKDFGHVARNLLPEPVEKPHKCSRRHIYSICVDSANRLIMVSKVARVDAFDVSSDGQYFAVVSRVTGKDDEEGALTVNVYKLGQSQPYGGFLSACIGGDGDVCFYTPRKLKREVLVVADYQSHRLVLLDHTTSQCDTLGETEITYPARLARDDKGRLWVASDWLTEGLEDAKIMVFPY